MFLLLFLTPAILFLRVTLCQHEALIRHIPSWPILTPGQELEQVQNISVTILLPQKFYSGNLKRYVKESEAALLAAQKRAGPAILAGLEEGVRRGREGGGPVVNYDIVIRDTQCDITHAAKVGTLICQCEACIPHIV